MTHPHHAALATRHQMIDRQLSEEIGRPHPDEIRMSELKKRKLKLKEQMATHG